MKLLKCSVCGNIVEMIEDKGVPVMCCGKPMDELKANTTDGALEKHVPVAEIADGNLHVKVGSMAVSYTHLDVYKRQISASGAFRNSQSRCLPVHRSM